MAKNVVFLGANGFPVHTYAPLLNKIRYDNSVASLFPIDYFKHFTELNSDWNNAVQHTIDKLLLSPSPVTAVGHSAGGALLMCVAGRRPELFEKLIVVDPPMFDLKMRVFISIGKAIPKQLVENVHPLVKGAVRKRDQFSSKTEAGEYFRSRSLFKSFDRTIVDSFLEHGIDNNNKLVFPKLAEANMYKTTPGLELNSNDTDYVGQYCNKLVKGTFFHSHEYEFLNRNSVAELKQLMPQMRFVEFEHNHFWPFQDPDSFTSKILEQINAG